MTSPPEAEPKSYQWSSSTQKDVGFVAPGRRGDTHRPPGFTRMPCLERYSGHVSLFLISCMMVITSYRTTKRVFRVEHTLSAAVITDIFAECPVDGFIRALSNLQLSKWPSTPGTYVMRFPLTLHQSPRIRPSTVVPSFSAINIAV